MGILKPDRMLDVGDGHRIAIYQKGNPEGIPFIFCHGGPGGRISERSFRYFDLYRHRVIAFDQRGCGQSTPFASVEANTVMHSVEDLEKIRQEYGLERMFLYGGSYGTTLALSYAISYPERVAGMVLRGIFLGRQSDIDWLYKDGASRFFPENFDRYIGFLPEEDRMDPVSGYEKIFRNGDENIVRKAARHWACWEGGLLKLHEQPVDFTAEPAPEDISLARLECWYFANALGRKDGEDNYILDHVDRIRDIPVKIIHGRYDVDCVPEGAWTLHKALRNSEILFPCAGHMADDLDHSQALIAAVERICEVWNEGSDDPDGR